MNQPPYNQSPWPTQDFPCSKVGNAGLIRQITLVDDINVQLLPFHWPHLPPDNIIPYNIILKPGTADKTVSFRLKKSPDYLEEGGNQITPQSLTFNIYTRRPAKEIYAWVLRTAHIIIEPIRTQDPEKFLIPYCRLKQCVWTSGESSGINHFRLTFDAQSPAPLLRFDAQLEEAAE